MLGYLTKQRSPRAWYLTNYTRKPGGKVLGKRYRISANLRAKPIKFAGDIISGAKCLKSLTK